MTSKLKCPVCQQELGVILCDTDDFICSKCRMCGTEKLWTALIQAKQDLEITRTALKDARIFANTHCIATAVKTIDKALEQIEHKEK